MVAGLAPSQRVGTAFPTAISAGLLKPLNALTSLWSANFASSPSSSTVLTEDERFSPRWALSNVGPVVPRRTYYREGDGGRPDRMVADVYEQNGEQIGQQNTDSLKPELEREGHIKANSSRSITANDVLEIREPEPLSREENRQSPPISEGEVTKSSVRQDLRIKEELRKAFRVPGSSSPALMKVGLNSAAEGRLQSHSSYGNKFSSRDSAEGIGRMYVHSAGTTTEAIAGLQNRLQRGIPTDSSTYNKVLRMCLKQKDLLAAKQVHGCMIKSRVDKNPYVASTLLNVYIKCGAFLDARRVFDELEKKTLIDWNSMIAAYSNIGKAVSAFKLFNVMRHEGVRPNQVTYLCILKAGATPSALKWGKEIHQCVRDGGFESDVRVGTALVQMYAHCGCITEARRVFEKLTNRNLITWNVMIGGLAQHGFGHEAFQLFLQMRGDGFEANAYTYMSILNASASAGALVWVKKVHIHALKAGLESDLRVGNALVHMYAKSGSLDDARLVFDRMEKRDVVTWTVMIGGLAQLGCGHEAYRLFRKMIQTGFEPNAITYLSILNASASTGALQWVKEVHGHAKKAGLESDLRVGNALIHMYAKTGNKDDAQEVFDSMEKRDLITWNTMIGAHAEGGRGMEAYGLFLQMRREGFDPDAFTYASILNASATAGALEWVKNVHGYAVKAGLESDLRVASALVRMYAKSCSLDDARLVFDRMGKRDVITWNIMIGACAESGRRMQAYGLFLQMRREGIEPDAVTYASILNASASAGALEWVRKVHGHALKSGLELELRVGSALVHMYAKSGSLDDARLVFHRMEKRDVVPWTVMIGGLEQHGHGQEALELFSKMIAEHCRACEAQRGFIRICVVSLFSWRLG